MISGKRINYKESWGVFKEKGGRAEEAESQFLRVPQFFSASYAGNILLKPHMSMQGELVCLRLMLLPLCVEKNDLTIETNVVGANSNNGKSNKTFSTINLAQKTPALFPVFGQNKTCQCTSKVGEMSDITS